MKTFIGALQLVILCISLAFSIMDTWYGIWPHALAWAMIFVIDFAMIKLIP